MKTQVDKEHYNKNYDQLPRWISYFYQIDSILKTSPSNILEIGKGNGLVSEYIRSKNIKIITCDFDKSLNPDIVADVRSLPFKENNFDMISCCEVLEHIPYEDFQKVLRSFRKISKKYILISLPSPGIYFSINIRFRGMKRIIGKETLSFFVNIPPFYKSKKFDGEHYWEIGYKKTPLRKIKKDIKKYLFIEKIFSNPFVPNHKFFLLRKNENSK